MEMTNEKAIMNLESWQIDLPTNSLQFEVFEKAIKALKVESCKKEEDKWMKVEEIIYHKLLRVMAMGPIIAKSDMEKLAHDAVEEIREEFRKAGVDVWPRWKGGEE